MSPGSRFGTGRNLSYDPQGVDLTGIECSPAMLSIAQEGARARPEVDHRLGDAPALEFPDDAIDTVSSRWLRLHRQVVPISCGGAAIEGAYSAGSGALILLT